MNVPSTEWTSERLQHHMWVDTSFFEARFHKSAAALLATVRMLQALQPVEGQDEFLDLFDHCRGQDPQAFGRLWHDPAAYAWSFRVFDNLGYTGTLARRVQDGGTEYADQWERHQALLRRQIGFFKAVAIGLHVLTGDGLELRTPLQVPLPFSIPGTGWFVDGQGELSLLGVSDGHLAVRAGGVNRRLPLADDAGVETELPVVRPHPRLDTGGCDIVVDPWLCRVPGVKFEEGQNALASPARPTPQDLGLLQTALQWLGRFSPEAFARFREHMRVFNLKSEGAPGVGAVSLTELPGSFTFKMCRDPVWLLETFVHEWFHNQLFFLDEETPILREIPGPAENYSPWRPDPRPPHGLIHAVYVHVPVARAFLRLHESGEAQGAAARYVEHNLIRMRWQMPMGLAVLEHACDLTDFGQAFMGGLRDAVADITRAIDAAGLDANGPALMFDQPNSRWIPVTDPNSDLPLTSREHLIQHARDYDRRGQVADWIDRI